jgi:hypothetical protein
MARRSLNLPLYLIHVGIHINLSYNGNMGNTNALKTAEGKNTRILCMVCLSLVSLIPDLVFTRSSGRSRTTRY